MLALRKYMHDEFGCFEIIGYPPDWSTRGLVEEVEQTEEDAAADQALVKDGLQDASQPMLPTPSLQQP